MNPANGIQPPPPGQRQRGHMGARVPHTPAGGAWRRIAEAKPETWLPTASHIAVCTRQRWAGPCYAARYKARYKAATRLELLVSGLNDGAPKYLGPGVGLCAQGASAASGDHVTCTAKPTDRTPRTALLDGANARQGLRVISGAVPRERRAV